ncbi:growth arrest and DNA damage-inducible proteins-interacting protein CRIF [Colletes latitarsis]|uniref:growth arrest and DNA damage-inducible proteins-interacting protein CRIF n=1 Tax=Colletes latitarsis TaxID=2605962 RepID=UPI004036A0FF
MFLKTLFANPRLTINFESCTSRCFASKAQDIIQSAESEPVYIDRDEQKSKNLYIESRRNKSRLNPQHRNILFDQKPYEKSITWFHDTLKYKRGILGKYGMKALGIPAGIAWPTHEELEDMKEYERVAFPLTLQERWQKIKEKHKEEEEAIMTRQNEIEAKMLKMNDIILEVEEKIAKKKLEAEEAKMKKERRVQEIRRQLIAAGHVTSDKIAEMMTKLEKEDKKKRKEAKKQRMLDRQQKLLAKNMPIETDTEVKKNEDPEDRKGSQTVEEPTK